MDNGTMNISNSLITVGLNPEDALKFRTFCQYYDQINYLLEAQVFERVRPGSFVVHLSQAGEIGRVELHPVIIINTLHNK